MLYIMQTCETTWNSYLDALYQKKYKNLILHPWERVAFNKYRLNI